MPKKYYVDQKNKLNAVKVEKERKSISVKEYAGIPILGEISASYDLYDSRDEALLNAIELIDECITSNKKEIKGLQKEIEDAEDRLRNNIFEKKLLKKQLRGA